MRGPVSQLSRSARSIAAPKSASWNERDHEQDVEIDLDRHRQVIEEALSEALERERFLMSEKGARAAQQRSRARARAGTVEAFMTAAGLDEVG